MKGSRASRNDVKAARLARGLSQLELARAAGVTRQTISGIEAGLYSPSVAVALRLARALGRSVDELFWLDEGHRTIEAVPAYGAVPASGAAPSAPVPVALTRIAKRWIAHPLTGDAAFRQELVPGDGVATWDRGKTRLRTAVLQAPETLERTVVLAGCSPALSLLARAAERAHPDLRVHWLHRSSEAALVHLARQEIHLAGVHLWDASTGDCNTPYVRQTIPGRRVVLVTLGDWEEGLAVRTARAAQIRGVEDLARRDVRIVNREEGSGARTLLSALLDRAGIPQHALRGFDEIVGDHAAVARAIVQGRADAGVVPAAVASVFGLAFVPLQSIRYDLVLLRDTMEHPPVRRLLGMLGDRSLRVQLQRLSGYDTTRTGAVAMPAA